MATTLKLTPRELAIARGEELPPIEAPPTEPIEDASQAVAESVPVEEPPNYEPSDDYPDLLPDDTVSQVPDDAADDTDPDNADWRTDASIRAYASSYGLSDDDLAGIQSQDELERFGLMMDRQLAGSAIQPQFQQYQQPAPREQQQPPPAQPEPPSDPTDDPDWVDIEQLKADNYDAVTIRLAEANNRSIIRERDRQKQEVERANQSAQEQERQLQSHIHQILDGMESDALGKSGTLSRVQSISRDAVYQTMLQMHQQLSQRGQGDIPLDVLTRRAASVALGDAVSQKNRSNTVNQQSQRIQQQSRRRRPTATGRGRSGANAPLPQGGSDDVSAIANSPQLKAFWERTQRENGVV